MIWNPHDLLLSRALDTRAETADRFKGQQLDLEVVERITEVK
jgi:hypothetical protein